MSYCVHCGVELHATAGACPLCDTPVLNPRQMVDRVSPTPYPMNVGMEEVVETREFTMVVSVVFLTISVVCGLVNYYFLNRTHWSLHIMGALAVAWVMLLPNFFRGKVHPIVCIALDGGAVALYVGMISLLHPGQGWYPEIALPIIVVSTVLVEVFYLFTIRHRSSAISKAVLIMGIIAVITVVIELLIGFHYHRQIRLTWSAVVLLCCVAADVILVTISLHKGLRNELRKRMHF